MQDLSAEDLAPLSQGAQIIMLKLILAWARYDALVTQWLSIAYRMPVDDGTLLIGNMDTRAKLDRLKSIYEHHGMAVAAARVDNLRKKHLELVFARNHIAHSICAGVLKDDPQKVVFLPFKARKGSLGSLGVYEVSLVDMATAARFARVIGDDLNSFNGKHGGQRGEHPPEPPVFVEDPRPGPRKKA